MNNWQQPQIVKDSTMQPLYSPEQVCTLLHVAEATLRKWRWEGKGPQFVKIGRKVAYQPDDIDNYIQTQIRTSTSDTGVNST